MKKLLLIPILLSSILFFVACERSKPDDVPVSVDDSAGKSIELIAAKGSNPNQSVTFSFSDFTKAVQYKKWLSKAEALSTSFVEVSGIVAEDVNMKNVTLSGAGKTLSLGNIAGNQKFMIDNMDRLTFAQAVMNEVVNKGTCTVTLNYTPETSMTDKDAKMKINLNVRFSFE